MISTHHYKSKSHPAFTYTSGDTTSGTNALQRSSSSSSIENFVSKYVREQHNINRKNAAMHAVNLYLNYAARHHSQQLETKVRHVYRDVEIGKIIVTELQSSLTAQREQLAALDDSVYAIHDTLDEHKGYLVDLTDRMDTQATTVSGALRQVDERLRTQRTAIEQQNETLVKLLNVRFRTDFGVDMGLFMLALWLSDTSIIRLLCRISAGVVTSVIPFQRRRARRWQQIHRLVVFIVLFRQFRSVAIRNGAHNTVGSATGYMETAKSTMKAGAQQCLAQLWSLRH